MLDLEQGHLAGAILGGRVEGERDACRKGRPTGVMIIWKQPEATVPKSPKHLNGAVASGVMTHRCGGSNVGCPRQKLERLR
jgi:hypothetical protein